MKISELLLAVKALHDYNSNQEVIAIIYTKDDVSSMIDPWDEFREPVPSGIIDAIWDQVYEEYTTGHASDEVDSIFNGVVEFASEIQAGDKYV